MREQGLSEETSFRIIQRQAMDRRKSMKEVAEAIILSQEIQQQIAVFVLLADLFHRLYHFDELIRWAATPFSSPLFFQKPG